MAFGKRVAGATPAAEARDAAREAEREALIEDLRTMARQSGTNRLKAHGTIDGRLVDDAGPGAEPALAHREGVADGRAVRRSDYWASNILGNLSAVIGIAGGVALGLSPQGAIGFMFIVWGLTAVATGRMMKSDSWSSHVFMGQAARLAGLGAIATGAWFIWQGRSEPAALSYFVSD